MAPLYPLRFHPLFRRYVWGGRKLASVLHKPVPDDGDCAESWEVCDRGADQSLVADGPLAGQSLGQLVVERGAELLGRHHPRPRFPLLLKFLDAREALSVQVHPTDQQAAQLDPPDLGKTEAWVVLDAEPGSAIYAGLKRGFDRQAVAREVARGTCELCLHRIEPAVGDCIFLPAGTVHAIGAGLLIAEIQQSSDVTFRLYDWNRLGPDGRPRPLHVDEALAAIDFERGPVAASVPQPTDSAQRWRLVTCDKFLLDRLHLDAPESIGGDERCHVLAVLAGEVDVPGDARGAALRLGETMLLPAVCGPVELNPRPGAIMLDAYLP